MIARNRVVGVINVQHRLPHQHTGSEMEVLATVGEQVGCMLVLARMSPAALESANHVELVLSSGPVRNETIGCIVTNPLTWQLCALSLLAATAAVAPGAALADAVFLR